MQPGSPTYTLKHHALPQRRGAAETSELRDRLEGHMSPVAWYWPVGADRNQKWP